MALAAPVENPLALRRPSLATLLNFTDHIRDDIRDIADTLKRINPIVTDAPAVPANNRMFHRTAYRVSKPVAYIKGFNEGVPDSYGEISYRTENLAMFASAFSIDAQLVDDIEDGAAYRMDQAKQHIEAMSDAMASAVFYGVASDKSFDGFATRYNTTDLKKNPLARQVVSCKSNISKGNYSSIYAIKWGSGSVHSLYPGNVANTIRHIDRGRHPVRDRLGNDMDVYSDSFTWYYGLAIPDTSCVVRLCNIDTQELRSGEGIGNPKPGAGETNLLWQLTETLGTLMDPNHTGDNLVLYTSRQVLAGLQVLAARSDAVNGILTQVLTKDRTTANVEEWQILGYTLKVCDCIRNDEVEVK